MGRLMRFPTARPHDPAIDRWLLAHPGAPGALALHWYGVIRDCGDDLRELLHDGHPVACVGDAAFAYVDVFRAHADVGFFLGAELADPVGLLEGVGKFMRHVKLRPGNAVDAAALEALLRAAYVDMKDRVGTDPGA
jgi:hypothetical protein